MSKLSASGAVVLGRVVLILLSSILTIAVACPFPKTFPLLYADSLHWETAITSVLMGPSLAGLFLAWPKRGSQQRMSPWCWFWLATAIGILLLLPPAIAGRFRSPTPGIAQTCLTFTLPLFACWFALSAALGGHLGFRRQTSWQNRCGMVLGGLWSLLGLWILLELYTSIGS